MHSVSELMQIIIKLLIFYQRKSFWAKKKYIVL